MGTYDDLTDAERQRQNDQYEQDLKLLAKRFRVSKEDIEELADFIARNELYPSEEQHIKTWHRGHYWLKRKYNKLRYGTEEPTITIDCS